MMVRRFHLAVALSLVVFAVGACSSEPVTAPTPQPPSSTAPPAPTPAPSPAPSPAPRIGSDSAFFTFVTQTQPFSGYAPFPNLSIGADGTLPASSAHQPLIRVTLNEAAAGALQNGRLLPGTTFPDGSVIFKEVLSSPGVVSVDAVMYKDRTHTNAGNGWLWAEYRPDGGVVFSMTNRGNACTGCHSLAQGPQNDFVRIFERQR